MARAMETRRRASRPRAFGGELVDRSLPLDELQRLHHAHVRFVFRHMLLVQAVRHILLDGERIEERPTPGRPCRCARAGRTAPGAAACRCSGRRRGLCRRRAKDNPFASFSRTDLPQPAGPSRPSVCPRSTEKEMFRSTGLASKAIDTSSNCTTGTLPPGGSMVATAVLGRSSDIRGAEKSATPKYVDLGG